MVGSPNLLWIQEGKKNQAGNPILLLVASVEGKKVFQNSDNPISHVAALIKDQVQMIAMARDLTFDPVD
jgi:hypothetical protein